MSIAELLRTTRRSDGYQTLMDSQGEEALRIYPSNDQIGLSKSALVTFASFCNPGRSVPSFAFLNSAIRARKIEGIKCDIYYLLAKKNDWYQSGLRGISGKNLFQSAHQLKLLLSDFGYSRTIFMGNSMGGFASLSFGALCGASSVVAFSPQTRFDSTFCKSIKEYRWKKEFESMRSEGDVRKLSVGDIWLRSKKTPNAEIHVGMQSQQDMSYAKELRKLIGVNLVVHEESGHDVALDLRSDGRLHEIITTALAE